MQVPNRRVGICAAFTWKAMCLAFVFDIKMYEPTLNAEISPAA